MKFRLALTAAKAFALGLVLTFFLVGLDQERTAFYQKKEYLKWARQLTVEASSWVRHAKNTVERDPYAFAAEMLSKTDVSRSFKIYPAQLSLGRGEVERAELDLDQGIFDYLRILEPETGRGFRVKIDLGYLGFLGTHSKIGSHFMIAVLLIFLSVLSGVLLFLIELKIWRGIRWWFNQRSKIGQEISKIQNTQLEMSALLKEVLTQGKTILNEVDTQIRLLNHSRRQIQSEVQNCSEMYKNLRSIELGLNQFEEKVLDLLMRSNNASQEDALALAQVTDEIDPVTRKLMKKIQIERERIRGIHKTLSAITQTQSTILNMENDVTNPVSAQSLQKSLSEVVSILSLQVQSVEAIENLTLEK